MFFLINAPTTSIFWRYIFPILMVTYYGPIVHMHWNHLPFSSWCVGTTTTLTGCFFAISRPMKRSIPVPVPNQGRSQNPLRSELFGAGFFLENSKCLKSNPPWLFVLEKMAELYVTNKETTDNSHHLFFCFCFAPVALTRKAGGLHGPAAWWINRRGSSIFPWHFFH